MKSEQTTSNIVREEFMAYFLKYRYNERFIPKPRYKTMFESEKHLIYFQNYSTPGANNWWYRLSESAFKTLIWSLKLTLICFSNPSENIVYEIPIKDLALQAKKINYAVNYARNDFEINIIPSDSRLRDLVLLCHKMPAALLSR